MLRALAPSLLVILSMVVPATDAHARSKVTIGKSKPVVLQWLKPNLTVDSLAIIEGSGDVMQKVWGQAVVRNTGLTSTGPFGVSLYTTINGKLDIQHYWFSQGLAPGGSHLMTWKLPAAPYNTTQQYVMGVSADPFDSVDELKEYDNNASHVVFK